MWRFVFWCSSQFCEQKNALIIIVFALITNSALNSAKKIEYRAKNFQKKIPEVQICDMIKLLKSTIVSLEQKVHDFHDKTFFPNMQKSKALLQVLRRWRSPSAFCLLHCGKSSGLPSQQVQYFFFFSASPKSYTRFQQNVFSSGFPRLPENWNW